MNQDSSHLLFTRRLRRECARARIVLQPPGAQGEAGRPARLDCGEQSRLQEITRVTPGSCPAYLVR